jgi:cytochrome P450
MMDPIYNPISNETLKDPYPVFSYLRQNHPVYWHEKMKSWILTSYADCRDVMCDSAIWARDLRRVGDDVPEEYVNMQSIDPPSSLPLRAGFNSAFQSFDTTRIGKFAYDTIHTLLTPLVEREQFCFMHDFALTAAEAITCEVFGLDRPGNNDFHEISYGIALQMDSGLVPEQRWEGRKVAPRLRSIVDQGFALRKEGGLFSAVIRVFENSDWSHKLMQASMDAMLNAAYSTMYTTFGSFALTLAQHPQVLSQMNSDNLSLAANEFLRYTSPAQATNRVATKETRIGNVQLKPRDTVITMFAAANRDPEIFANPDELNVNRAPNPHLGFGFGPHMCLGAMLARIISKQFLANMITMPQLHIMGEPRYFRTATLRWLESLPSSFRKDHSIYPAKK